MAEVAGHLILAVLQAGYRTSGDARLARHYQVIEDCYISLPLVSRSEQSAPE